ncbi:hypothetical protein LTR15_005658 [Elasticomyces elasticus]|nr:hypothetical protein LTR15_005658 [Elasticomyces elasticus]
MTETLETSSDPDYIAPSYSHIDSWHDSAATPAQCNEKGCETCDQHYRPVTWQEASKIFQYHECITDDWAVYKIRDLMQSAQTDLKHVASRLELHGNANIKRWRKKSVEKRIGLLRAVMPDMPEAAFSLLYQQKRLTGEDRTLFHELWLLPYLDLQSLSEHPTRLLSMLHYRTRHRAEEWFRHDAHQLLLPFTDGSLHIAYNPHAVVARGERFGDLQQWTQLAAHRWDVIGLPRALATFEAQAKLAKFLRVFVDTLLEGIPPVGNDAWLALVGRNFAKSTFSSEDELSRALERPFGRPPSCDLGDIDVSLVYRWAMSNDALFRAQTEPEQVCSRLERARSSEWLLHQNAPMRSSQYLRIMLGPLERTERFVWLMHLTRHVVSSEQEYTAGVITEEKYLQSILLLRRALNIFLGILTCDLQGLVAMEPTFEHHRCYCGPGYYPVTHTADSVMHTVDPLYWALCRLQERGPSGPFYFNDDQLLGVLSSVLSRKAQRGRISDEVYTQLKDISAVSEALISLRNHTPYSSGTLTTRQSRNLSAAISGWADWDVRCELNACMVYEQPIQLLGPLYRLFLLPSASEDSAVARYGKGQVALTAFWTRVREVKHRWLIDSGFQQSQTARYLSSIEVHLTEEYHAKMELAACEARALSASMSVVALSDPQAAVSGEANRADDVVPTTTTPGGRLHLPPIQTAWGHANDPEPASSTSREKVKTRPSNTPVVAETPIVPATSDWTRAPRHASIVSLYEGSIAVSSESFDLFVRMFTPLETHKGTPSVQWDDMVAAFADAGCRVVSKLIGATLGGLASRDRRIVTSYGHRS